MRSLWISLIGSLFLVVQAAWAQTPCSCYIKGKVIDRESNQPIPGATVIIQETGLGAVTDTSGNYRIDHLCPQRYTLLARILGYKEIRQTLTIEHESSRNQDFLLDEDAVHLHDVNVTAQKTAALSSQAVQVLAGRELDQTRGQSLGEALKKLPGVTTLQTGSTIAKPVIHGFHSNRILILNNGIRQEGQQWGSEHAPEIDPFIASRVSLVKGASGVRYGSDAIGGVILVEPAPLPATHGQHGELNMVGFTNGRQGVVSGQTENTLGKDNQFAWRVQGTLKRGGNLQTPGYYLSNTGTSEQNGSVAMAYRTRKLTTDLFYSRFNTKIGIFTGAHIGSLTDLEQVLASGEPYIKSGFSYAIDRPSQQVQHDLLKWRTTYKPSEKGLWTLTLARQFDDRSEFDLHRPRNDSLAALNRPELRFRLTTYTGDLVFEHKPVGALSGQAGVTGMYQFNIMNGRPLIPNFRTFAGGAFWIEKLRKERWEYEAGLRFDVRHMQVFRYQNGVLTSPVYAFANGSGTLGATYTLNQAWTSRVNLGTAWRAPNVSELFSDGVHHGAAAYELGDPGLQPEKAYNLNWNTTYTGKRIQAEVDLFYNYIRDYIYLQPQAEPRLTIRGAFPFFKYTQTDVIYTGFDASATVTLLPVTNQGGLLWTTKLAYLYVQDVVHHQPLVWIAPNRFDNALRFELPVWGRDTQKKGEHAHWHDLYAEISNLLVARQNRVPANSDFVAPPPAYALWNAAVGATFPFAGEHGLTVSLSVNNLFNTVYRDYLNRFRYFADDPGRNLAVRLKWSF